ncbi:hypothetical protein E2C01_089007 [Portunus trituberculatus]|uniref:Uncharacterized protein n=1 Tax=Portunus trituberculatus TaxID=210409 RepID=A0A5B7JCD6_PORTR|nr:hypothetical protein [Portunus trituberculatus]
MKVLLLLEGEPNQRVRTTPDLMQDTGSSCSGTRSRCTFTGGTEPYLELSPPGKGDTPARSTFHVGIGPCLAPALSQLVKRWCHPGREKTLPLCTIRGGFDPASHQLCPGNVVPPMEEGQTSLLHVT